MKTMKKILAMLLVVLMLTTVLVSCKKDPQNDPSNTDPTTTPTNSDPNRIPPAEKDFGEYEFKFLMDGQTDYELQVPEQIGSDGINKALVERNKLVENKYNVKISETRNKHTDTTAAFNYLKDMQSSGDYFADMYSNYAIKMIQSHAISGFYLNACELDSLRLDSEWWDQDFNEEFMINNHLYVLTGDIQTNDDLHQIMTSMNLTLYNETYPEKNFYEIVVKNGAWTWEEFYNTWNNFGSNDGGTPGVVDSDDKVGYYYDCRTVNYMYVSSGMRAFSLDANNQPVLEINSQKAIEVCKDRMQQILDGHTNLKSVRLDDNKVNPGTYEAGNNHFAAGKALFVSNNFTDVLAWLSDMEDTSVYPPFPKYNAEQDRYYSLVHKDFEAIALCANVQDVERTALLAEALCFYSDALENEVMRVLLKERLTTEEETRAILQLTLNSKGYDFEYTANIMDWTSSANNLLVNGTLAQYKDDMEALAKLAVNTRGSGKLQVFLSNYAGLNFR